MKKNITNLLIIMIFTLLTIFIFFNRQILTKTVMDSVELWLTKVFPTLFIMFIINDFLIKYNFAYYFKKIFGKFFTKLFKLSNNAQMAFILSIISGSPMNGYIINNLYKHNQLSSYEANRLLHFTYFANPLFLYNILIIIFNSHTTSLKIIFSVYISNFILALVIPSKFEKFNNTINNNNDSFGVFLVESIKKSINNIILILGSITFFMILSNIITLNIDNIYIKTIISGLFEITNGLNNVTNLNILTNVKEIIVTLIISFGGLSIHSQVYSMIYSTDLKYFSFLKGRLFSCVISIIILLLF